MTARLVVPVALLVAFPASAGSRVTLCHQTGSKVVEITVSSAAVPAHLRSHGDYYPLTWYADADGDGYGDSASTFLACTAPDGTSSTGGDPDDSDPTVYPGAQDVCDGTDNDADGSTDEDSLAGHMLVARVGTRLVLYDRDTGTTTELVALSSADGLDPAGINAISTNPATNVTYAVEKNSDQLVTADTCTGEISIVGPVSTAQMCGMAWGGGGLLYGIDGGLNVLLEVDPRTGTSTTIGSLGFDLNNCGLAYDCATDTLYGLHINPRAGQPDWVFSIDPVTGAATPVTLLDPTVAWSQAGLEVDSAAGQFYIAMVSGIYAVDMATGTASLIGEGDSDALGWWRTDTCD